MPSYQHAATSHHNPAAPTSERWLRFTTAEKLARVRPFLDEKQWQLLLAAEAQTIGWGGIELVARLAGASPSTVRTGVNEIRVGLEPDGRVRAQGTGRPAVEAVPLTRQAFHGEWNYTIRCGLLPESLPGKTFDTKSTK